MCYLIGLDIGGTHTDGVVIDRADNIVARAKQLTTEDLQSGVRAVLRILSKSVDPEKVDSIFLGTTHGTNAILQGQDLERVGLLRLAGRNPSLLPPAISWPKQLSKAAPVIFETVNGGYECDRRPLTPLSLKEVTEAAERLLEKGALALSLVGTFSPLCPDQERAAAAHLRSIFGSTLPLSLSCEIGGLGFMERENAALLNAALKRTMKQGFMHMQQACRQEGFNALLYVTHNDGSLLTLSEAIEYPVLTLAAGPTNSLIGGARLAGCKDAVVIDVGGTSTDVGMLKNGTPMRSMQPSTIGGVTLHFSAPDVLSIALGGGSKLCLNTQKMGPASVGRELKQQALCFGGNEVTFTDIAIRLGHMHIPGVCLEHLQKHPNMPSERQCQQLYMQAEQHVTQLVRQMRGREQALPCVFVGGGSRLFSATCPLKAANAASSALAEYFDVANAYGAALAEISGTVDTLVSLTQRESTLEALKAQATERAIAKGANPNGLRLIDQQIIPYPYASGQMARVIMRMSGRPKG